MFLTVALSAAFIEVVMVATVDASFSLKPASFAIRASCLVKLSILILEGSGYFPSFFSSFCFFAGGAPAASLFSSSFLTPEDEAGTVF